ncbi:MAG: cytochrome P450 [Myxococcales bacterium]|nr:cytochrome P450 [Myxococcales bacterium]
MGNVRDPYPIFAAMREQGPVAKIATGAFMGEGGDVQLPPGLSDEIYVALSHDAVSQVLRDGKTFSSAGYAESMGPVMGRTILQMDEPEHSRYRGLIQKAFTKKAIDGWERELIDPVVNGLIDRFAARGHADLVRELTFPFPVAVIAGMMGLPTSDFPDFHRLAVELISVGLDAERGMKASKGLEAIFSRVLADRRRAPRDDLISVLAQAELEGTRLTDDEIYAFLRLLAPAGAETTYRSSSNLLFGLLSNPVQLEALREDRSLMPQAISEGLRWECPLLGIMRTATCDVEVEGVAIPAGSTVSVNLGSANRDPSRYERPDEFDLFREPRTNMAFALGPHRCLGMHLAKTETEVVLNAVLDRLPGLQLDPAAEDVHITGMIFRAPQTLPVVFEPAPTV